MSNFLEFWTTLLRSVSSFLMTEPVSWFVAIALLTFVVGLFFKIIGRRDW